LVAVSAYALSALHSPLPFRGNDQPLASIGDASSLDGRAGHIRIPWGNLTLMRMTCAQVVLWSSVNDLDLRWFPYGVLRVGARPCRTLRLGRTAKTERPTRSPKIGGICAAIRIPRAVPRLAQHHMTPLADSSVIWADAPHTADNRLVPENLADETHCLLSPAASLRRGRTQRQGALTAFPAGAVQPDQLAYKLRRLVLYH
jgi:hypothetical protein